MEEKDEEEEEKEEEKIDAPTSRKRRRERWKEQPETGCPVLGAQNSNQKQTIQNIQTTTSTNHVLYFSIPPEVINLPITPPFDHGLCPQSQEIRLGRKRPPKEGCRCVNHVDASAADFDKVDSDTEALRSIERDFAVGLETERAAGPSTLSDVREDFRRGRNIHVLSVLDRGVGNAGCTTDEYHLVAQVRPDKTSGCLEAL
ncbi:hypothetical protein CSUB01_04705 [Colletotrichum sublineola]|uniref:Uncharacterized protein n=1 Tax=Colletotrichum sublineola TaxID=1173701 RepID=A0A066XEW9_COLSU|nr:hypothetical protein CSUB01_04705 [Colletotrichum sublineola]